MLRVCQVPLKVRFNRFGLLLLLLFFQISERVHLDAQLYNWNGWYFFCMGQLLSIFNGFAFITIQLQPEDGGLRVLCIHNSTHRNSPVPIQLHPGENPFSRPSKSN